MSLRSAPDILVLRATDKVLKRTGGPINQVPVLQELCWPDDQLDQVIEHLAELARDGYLELVAPPLTGDNRVLDVMVRRITAKGRQRLTPWWRRGGRRALGVVGSAGGAAVLAVLAAINRDVLVPQLTAAIKRLLRVP